MQAATSQDGKPILGRVSSKISGLLTAQLSELGDLLNALEGMPVQEGQCALLFPALSALQHG